MSGSLTSRLKLYKPDPGTGDPVDVAKLNQALDKIDTAIAPADVTFPSRPVTPYPNQLIRESDTDRLYVWNAGDGRWDQVVIVGPSQTLLPVEIERSSAAGSAFVSKVSGDTVARYVGFADGKVELGSGAAARDTNLYRAAANVLATDDALRVGGDYVAGSNDGVNAAATTSSGVGLSDTTTSASYVNMAGAGSQTSFSFIKRFPSTQTRIKIHMSGSMWGAGTLPVAVMFGVRINSTDFDVYRQQIDAAAGNNTYGQGIAYVSGIPAGTYTVQGRWKRLSGTATPNRDTGNWLTIMAEEVSV